MRPDRAVSRFHHGSGSSMKYLAPSAPLSIGGVLDQWLVLFRASWRRCWTLPLVMIPIIATLQFFVLAPGVYRSPPGLPPGQILIHLLASSRAPRLMLYQILLQTGSVLVNGLLMAQQVAVIRGDAPSSFRSVLTDSVRRLPRLLLTLLLLSFLFIAIAGVMLLGIVLFGTAAKISLATSLRHDAFATATVALGALFFTLLVYLWVRFGLSFAAIFAQDYGPLAALRRSWTLVRNHWWRVAIITAVSMIIILIFALTTGSVTHFLVNHFIRTGSALRNRIAVTLDSFENVVVMPLATAAGLTIYYDLKLRLEGDDLAARTATLGSV